MGPIPHFSKCLSPESAGICCVPTFLARRRTREQNKVTERRRDASLSSYSLPLPELKIDSWRNASMAVSRDCNCSPPSNTWDSFSLVGHSDGATNASPPQEGKRREGKKRRICEWGAIIQCQCPTGPSAWLIMDHHLPCSEWQPNGFYCLFFFLQVPQERAS